MTRFITFHVGEIDYKLRLTSSAVVDIEKKLGKSIFKALDSIQDNLVETLVTILWAAMQPLNSGISLEKAYELFDVYIDEEHSVEDFIQVVTKLFEVSGFFKQGQV